MTVWKNRVLSNVSGAGENDNGSSSPRAFSEATIPLPSEGIKISREESAESISDNPLVSHSEAPDELKRIESPTSEMEIVKAEDNTITESAGEGVEGLATEQPSITMEIAG